MSTIESHDYKIDILYEDESLIFLDKPSSLLVHPYKSKTNEKVNLLKIVRDHLGHYVYPVHRLDRPVSGVIVMAKNSNTVPKLQKIWHESVSKKYLALVSGILEQTGEFNFKLNNEKKIPQEALTKYKVLEYFKESCLVEIKILTGRRHQIRRHFSRRMHHVIGDTRYGKGKINHYYRDNFNINRIFLHSASLEIQKTDEFPSIRVDSEIPANLRNALSLLRA